MISSPRQAPGGAADNPVASAAATPSTAMQTPIDFHFVSGSMRDKEVIEAADAAGLAMVFTGMR